ncbi:MAG: rhodanese-like domain-containing protein [Lentilactobacillus diolivorans]|uniref:rhodanese-like domain-containing protein n=1 Tax=Lentilactobacillus diolivorans TaxID=179838 RepID=UPI0039EA085A
MKINSVNTTQLEKRFKVDLIVIGVREPMELRLNHISGTINVPLSELTVKIKPLDPQLGYLMCRSGARNMRAANLVMTSGCHVVNVKGGVSAWDGPVSSIGGY